MFESPFVLCDLFLFVLLIFRCRCAAARKSSGQSGDVRSQARIEIACLIFRLLNVWSMPDNSTGLAMIV